MLHDAPLPPWPGQYSNHGQSLDAIASHLDGECEWLITNGVLLGDVVAGYGTDVDLDVIRAWWSLRSLLATRWLIEHGFDPSSPGCEFDVLRSQL